MLREMKEQKMLYLIGYYLILMCPYCTISPLNSSHVQITGSSPPVISWCPVVVMVVVNEKAGTINKYIKKGEKSGKV